jgi:nitroreductase
MPELAIRGWTEERPLEMRRIVSLASRAPSLHNSQPWRFVAAGDTVELWASRDRALPATDVDGRELEISCGAALGHLELALAAAGRCPRTTLVPDPATADLLAVVDVSQAGSPTVAESLLAEQIPLRHSNRHPFTARAIDAAVVPELMRMASAAGAWLLLLHADDRGDLAVLVQEAEQDQLKSEEYVRELGAWTSRDPARPDGISLDEVPDDASHAGIAVRAFDLEALPSADRLLDDAPVLVILGTERDDTAAHLCAGRALSAVLLHLEAVGLSVSIHSQPTERASTRASLRRRAGIGEPQLLLRIGYTDQPGSRTRRRPVADVLTARSGARRG